MKKLSEKELNEILGGLKCDKDKYRLYGINRLSVEALGSVAASMGCHKLADAMARLDVTTMTAEAFCSMAAGLGVAREQIAILWCTGLEDSKYYPQ